MKYMDERLGAWQIGDAVDAGAVEFKLFLPAGADPHITSIRVPGSFQSELGQPAWDFLSAPSLVQQPHPEGTLWTYTTPLDLP
ncbi:MAG TPA: alpha-amylase, partial [Chloroflexota bacterium]